MTHYDRRERRRKRRKIDDSKETKEPQVPKKPRADHVGMKQGIAPGLRTMTVLSPGQCWSTVYGTDGKPMGVGVVGKDRASVVVKPTTEVDDEIM